MLRHHQAHVQDNIQDTKTNKIPQNIARYRETVSTALLLELILVFSYLPFTFISDSAVANLGSNSR